MFQLVYASSAVDLFTTDQLRSMLEAIRPHNLALGVTGILLYRGGNIMQILEGSRAVVEGLAARIEQDPRHSGYLKLMARNVTERQFGSWSMAFADLDEDTPPGHSDFLSRPSSTSSALCADHEIRILLDTFREKIT